MTLPPPDASMEREEIQTEIERINARIEEINAERQPLSDQIDKLHELNKSNSTPETFDAEGKARIKRFNLLEELGQKHQELDQLQKKLESLPPEQPPKENKPPESEQPKGPEREDDKNDGTDAGDDDLENASPENRKFMDDLMQPGDPVDEILLKKPEDLTQDEFLELKKAMIDLPAGPEQERLDKAATSFLEHRYSTKPVRYDAVGRMIDPKPVNAIPEEPKPLATADRKPLKYALRRIGLGILMDAKDDGLDAAVKRLQGGINILSQAPGLKEDGVFGPKTRSGLKGAVAAWGTPKIKEGLALGRFNGFAREGRKDGFRGLAEATEKNFAPLFRNPAKPPRRPTDHIEAVTLQETLNDLGGAQFGRDIFKPLKIDGDIGPKTTGAFRQIAAAVGPEPLTKRFGEFMGFL
ncbi:MAG: hypothetical protein O3A85_14895 [Proteobacteria bacterium]|nr:hypothetical protein [Pseudomonadota bacterium]